MKKILLVALMMLLVGSFAMAQTNVVSVNVVGYTKVDVPSNGLAIVAVPFNPMSGATNYTLDGLIGTNMVAGDETTADLVYLWTGTKYNIAFFNDNGWGDPAIDWKWCYMDIMAGYPVACATDAAYDLEVGDAFWIVNRHSAKTITLLGEVPNELSISSTMSGLVMMGNPYPVTKQLDDLIKVADGAKAGDETTADLVYLWDGAAKKYNIAFLNDNGWGDPAIDWKWCYMDIMAGYPVACATDAAYTLEPGKGFWYIGRGTNFTLTVARPYTL